MFAKKKIRGREHFQIILPYGSHLVYTKIQIVRSDNNRSYFAQVLGEFFFLYMDNGIIQQSSCNDTPQQNGKAKRKNRHLLEVAKALMFSMNIPKHLWGEAMLHSTYLVNRMLSIV